MASSLNEFRTLAAQLALRSNLATCNAFRMIGVDRHRLSTPSFQTPTTLGCQPAGLCT